MERTIEEEYGSSTHLTRKRVAAMLMKPIKQRRGINKPKKFEDHEEEADEVDNLDDKVPNNTKNIPTKKSRGRKKYATIQDPDQVYEVERIIDVRWNHNGTKREYLISWKGYTEKHNTWEPEESFVSSLPVQLYHEPLRYEPTYLGSGGGGSGGSGEIGGSEGMDDFSRKKIRHDNYGKKKQFNNARAGSTLQELQIMSQQANLSSSSALLSSSSSSSSSSLVCAGMVGNGTSPNPSINDKIIKSDDIFNLPSTKLTSEIEPSDILIGNTTSPKSLDIVKNLTDDKPVAQDHILGQSYSSQSPLTTAPTSSSPYMMPSEIVGKIYSGSYPLHAPDILSTTFPTSFPPPSSPPVILSSEQTLIHDQLMSLDFQDIKERLLKRSVTEIIICEALKQQKQRDLIIDQKKRDQNNLENSMDTSSFPPLTIEPVVSTAQCLATTPLKTEPSLATTPPTAPSLATTPPTTEPAPSLATTPLKTEPSLATTPPTAPSLATTPPTTEPAPSLATTPPTTEPTPSLATTPPTTEPDLVITTEACNNQSSGTPSTSPTNSNPIDLQSTSFSLARPPSKVMFLDSGLQLLRQNAIGLFVRLKVDSAYCLAQVLDVFEDTKESYCLGGISTSIFLIVAFDGDKTLTRLSYISDGAVISEDEYSIWKKKLKKKKMLMTAPSKSGVEGNLSILLSVVKAVLEPEAGVC